MVSHELDGLAKGVTNGLMCNIAVGGDRGVPSGRITFWAHRYRHLEVSWAAWP